MSTGIGDIVGEDDDPEVPEGVVTGINDIAEGNTASKQDLEDALEFDETLDLKVMSVEHTDSQSGTTIHLFGRDESGGRHHIEVDGHDPSFFIGEDEYTDRVDNHYAVKRTETHGSSGDRYTTLYDEPLVRVYTHQSSSVGEMRELFEDTYEADVMYDARWKIDNEIITKVRVDTSEAITDEPWLKGEMRVENGAVEARPRDADPTPQPRITAFDIEVASESGFPSPDEADWPVSTIVAWDSYTDEYVGWILQSDEWDSRTHERVKYEHEPEHTGVDTLRVFSDESALLDDFHQWMVTDRPDIITGWNSDGFDVPYLINRSKDLNVYSYQDWSPLGETWHNHFGPVVKGVECVDMMGAYEKTQKHDLDSKKLEAVATDELGEGKVPVIDSHTEMWKSDPVEFLKYNKVDVELVHGINDSSGALDMLDHLRNIAGVAYSDLIGGAFEMMDMVFLRKAAEYGYRLPTAEEPEVGDFRGAWVYTPEPGLHEHCIYPDYSSLYPNVQYQCNISPETLIGTKEDLEASEYTEDDCVWSYVDTETPPEQKEDVPIEDDMMERVFFLKPSVKEGFVRAVLDDIMGLADRYTGGMYEAAKKIRNASWGVAGDSDSYGDGFRLFDWRLAEATTLGGQQVLKGGADYFVDALDDPDAYVVGGDTDSYQTSLPNAEGGEDALETAFDAAEETNEWLDGFTAETFGLESTEEARMELEIESYAPTLFYKAKDGEPTKKRYVQLITWNDEDEWVDDPSPKIKGFEYVRSDVAPITKEVQYETFEILLDDDGDKEERIKEVGERKIEEVFSGEHDEKIGIPCGIGQALSEYGSPDRRPQYKYRGAKFANKFVYGTDAIGEGDKPLEYRIKEGQTGGDIRKTFEAATAEDGDYVDCITVFDVEDLPDDCVIDRPSMAEKTILSPMEDIWNTLGYGTDWAERAIEQATPPSFRRDEGQTGLDAANFM